jgi:FtsP/CotA-like multicopper oxidase with cupredoxin domain
VTVAFFDFNFEREDGTRLAFTVVGNDQGVLSDPTIEIFLGPAERYEIIVAFSHVPEKAYDEQFQTLMRVSATEVLKENIIND